MTHQTTNTNTVRLRPLCGLDSTRQSSTTPTRSLPGVEAGEAAEARRPESAESAGHAERPDRGQPQPLQLDLLALFVQLLLEHPVRVVRVRDQVRLALPHHP